MVHIEIRPAASEQVKALMRGQQPEIGVRVYAQPGGGGCGCGGGASAVIDYVESLSESGFKITNPSLPEPDEGGKAGGCGSCGESSASGGGCGCG
jgi:Fe-S cluster assembly iron-binding protein IscA